MLTRRRPWTKRVVHFPLSNDYRCHAISHSSPPHPSVAHGFARGGIGVVAMESCAVVSLAHGDRVPWVRDGGICDCLEATFPARFFGKDGPVSFNGACHGGELFVGRNMAGTLDRFRYVGGHRHVGFRTLIFVGTRCRSLSGEWIISRQHHLGSNRCVLSSLYHEWPPDVYSYSVVDVPVLLFSLCGHGVLAHLPPDG